MRAWQLCARSLMLFFACRCPASSPVQSDLHSPHNKTIMYPTGFLPCRYLKVKCVRGTPAAMYKSVDAERDRTTASHLTCSC